MKTKLSISLFTVALLTAAVCVFTTTDSLATRGGEGGRGDGPVVLVTSQGLYYDSVVTADPLPAKGPFQLLEMGAMGLETEFGPGDPEYLGGRWKEDIDGDGVYHFFLCPLLGPGRPTP